MKRLMVVVLIFSTLLACSHTVSEEEKREQVAELMELLSVEDVFANMRGQIEGLMKAQLTKIEVAPEEQPIVDKYEAKMNDVVQKSLAWHKLKKPVEDIYLENFNSEEIEGMLDFYRSEIGQTTVQRLPKVIRESTLLGQQLAQGYVPQIQQLARQLDAEIKAARGRATKSQQSPDTQ